MLPVAHLFYNTIPEHIAVFVPSWQTHQNGKVETGVCEQQQMQEAYLYHDGILKLVPTWYKCINLPSLCAEK